MIKGLIFYENAEIPIREGIISSNRPVVIVSQRMFGDVVQVIPLTSSDRRFDGMKHHVNVDVDGRKSVALCEQIRTVNTKDLSRMPKGICSKEEIDRIDSALAEMIFGGEIQYEE